MNSEVRKIRVYSLYEVPELEQWLEEKAREGLILSRCGMNSFYFEKAEPQELLYRVVEIPKREASKTLEAFERGGWHKVCKENNTHILCGRKQDVPEEKEIRKNQNTQLVKRWKTDLIYNLVIVLVFMMNILLLITPGYPLCFDWIRLFSGFDVMLLYALCIVINMGVIIKRICDIKRLKRYLQCIEEDGAENRYSKRKQHNERACRLRTIASIVIIVMLCIYVVYEIATIFTVDTKYFRLKDIPNMVDETTLTYEEDETLVYYYENDGLLERQYTYEGEFTEELYVLKINLFTEEFMKSLLIRGCEETDSEIEEVAVEGLDEVYVISQPLSSGYIVARKDDKVLYLGNIHVTKQQTVLELISEALNK